MQKKENHNSQLKLATAVLLAVILLLADLYVIIHKARNFFLIAGFTFLLLIVLCFIVDKILAEVSEDRERKEKYFADIFRSEKASYLLLKKSFEELSKCIQGGNHSGIGQSGIEEIVDSQKAIAKVLMNHDKKNVDEIMELNHQMLEQLFQLGMQLSENQQQPISTPQEEPSYVQEILQNQNRILTQLQKLQDVIKEETETQNAQISQIMGQAQNELQTKIEVIAQKWGEDVKNKIKEEQKTAQDLTFKALDFGAEKPAKEEVEQKAESSREILFEALDFGAEKQTEPKLSIDNFDFETEDSIKGGLEEEVSHTGADIGILNDVPTERVQKPASSELELDALLKSLDMSLGTVNDSEKEEVLPQEEPMPDDDVYVDTLENDLPADSVPSTEEKNEVSSSVQETESIMESLFEEELDLSSIMQGLQQQMAFEQDLEETAKVELDRNGEPVVDTMPEVDAVLDETQQSDIPVEKIDLKDEIIEEKKPPMPDVVDPNKVMTPEEIAALLASL